MPPSFFWLVFRCSHDEPYVVVDALKAVQAGFQVAPPEVGSPSRFYFFSCACARVCVCLCMCLCLCLCLCLFSVCVRFRDTCVFVCVYFCVSL